MRMTSIIGLACLVAILGSTRLAVLPAAEIVIVGPDNWESVVPKGKEVDAIYGDFVLRNDKLVAVIARPVPTRNANMTVKNVGGCLLDFTNRDQQNDQLGAWYPLGKAMHWRLLRMSPEVKEPNASTTAPTVAIQVATIIKDGELAAETTYELSDGADYLNISTKVVNLGSEPIAYSPTDEIRADGTVYVKGTSGDMGWAYDRWWNAAYGILAMGTVTGTDPKPVPLAADRQVSIPAGGSVVVVRAHTLLPA